MWKMLAVDDVVCYCHWRCLGVVVHEFFVMMGYACQHHLWLINHCGDELNCCEWSCCYCQILPHLPNDDIAIVPERGQGCDIVL